MSTYRYPPLNPSTPSIRLVKLLACSRVEPIQNAALTADFYTDVIKCQLVLSYVDSNVEYEAVSYYWGYDRERERRCPISLDGQRFLVSPVVLDLLIRLHNPKQDRLLWIDLICIDQSNNFEKTVQVGRMREIFSKAQSVIASIGPHRTRSFPETHAFQHGIKALQTINSKSKILFSRLKSSEDTDQILADFLLHPWFERVWIIQEAAVARRLYIISGTEVADGESIARIPKLFTRPNMSQTLRTVIQERTPFFEMLSSSTQKPARPELLILLHRFRTWRATDPRDKVYALLGLASDDTKAPELAVDYNIPVAILYKRIVKYMLVKYQSLSILTYNAMTSTTPSDDLSTIPSWCPDWNERKLIPRAPDPMPRFSSEVSTPNTPFNHFTMRRNSLTLYGFALGFVSSIFHDSSMEVTPTLSPAFTRAYWPWQRVSEFMKTLSSDLDASIGQPIQKDDVLCLLIGSTGLTVLRPHETRYRLVVVQHSQFLPVTPNSYASLQLCIARIFGGLGEGSSVVQPIHEAEQVAVTPFTLV